MGRFMDSLDRMPQKQVSKRHHYIPEFYLSRWSSGEQKKLVQYSKPYGGIVKPYEVSPKQTGWVPKLYWLNGLPNEVASAVEDEFFKPIDTHASIVMSNMHAGSQSFSPADRVAWTQFLMSLVFRHPENLKATKERLSRTIRTTTRAQERQYRKVRAPDDPKTLAEALRLEIERDPDRVHRQVVELVADITGSEKIGRHIYSMRWGSLRMPLGVPALLTSDRPLHWFGGLADRGCHILMPIGPKRVFYAVNELEMAAQIMTHTPTKLVEILNEHTVRRARDYVYGMTDDRLDYVQQYMGTGQDLSIADLVAQVPTLSERKRRKAVFNPPWLHGGG